MNSIVFVYLKDGKIKTLDISHTKNDHDKMINEGWKHTSTVNASVFIEELFNNVPDGELRKSIKSLAIT
jgi:uncharacterized lipoprotein YajG